MKNYECPIDQISNMVPKTLIGVSSLPSKTAVEGGRKRRHFNYISFCFPLKALSLEPYYNINKNKKL